MKSNKTETIKYFAYMRKSSEDKERQALSIPAQMDKLKEQFGDLDIEFIQEERSAFTPYNRPKFADMLERIRKGERSGVIAWHPDRLSRNEVDASSITYMIRMGLIKDLKIATYHFENTPEGIWMLQMALSQSQYESAKKGRDVKRGLAKKADMGTYPAPAPIGYLNDKYEERGRKKIYTDKERHPLLRKMVDLMLTGNYTPPRIREIANEDWGFRTPNKKKMALSTIYNIFTRPFYYGEYEYPVGSGKWYKGNHEPLMTKEEYDQIQYLLGRKDSPRPKTHRDMAYRGNMHCGECGALVTAEHKYKKLAGGGVAHYIYYHCTKKKNPDCTQKCIEEKEFEKQIDVELGKIEIPEDFKKWALACLKEANANEITEREQIYGNQRKEYEASIRKIDNLIDMRANEEIDEEEFRNRKTQLLKEKEKFNQLLKDTDQRVNNWLEIAERGFNFAERAVSAFTKAKKENNLDLKKEIFSGLGSDYTLKDGKLSILLDDLLLPIQKASSELQKFSNRLEPRENVGVAKNFGENYSEIPQMLRDLDSNQDESLQRRLSYH